MGVLISCLGNSDLSIRSAAGKELVWRQSNFRDITEYIAGHIPALPLKYNAEYKIVYQEVLQVGDLAVKEICFPIFQDIFPFITDNRIDCVYFLVTNQETAQAAVKMQDTLFLYSLFEQVFAVNLPDVQVHKLELNGNPADYDAMIVEINARFPRNLEGAVFALLSASTPAMIYSLAQLTQREYPAARHVYKMRPLEGEGRGVVKKITTFYEQEKQRQIEGFMQLFRNANYDGCLTLWENSYFKQKPQSALLLKALSTRINYAFNETGRQLEALKATDIDFYNAVQPYFVYVDKLGGCFKGKNLNIADYFNEHIGYVFWENYYNMQFYFKHEQYLIAMALFSSFIDNLNYYFTSLQAGENMVYNIDNNFQVLNDFIRKSPDIRKAIEASSNDRVSNCIQEDGVVKSTAPVFRKLMQLFGEKDLKIKMYSDMYKKYNLDRLKELRNYSPIGHSIKGFMRENIETVMAKGNIAGFLEDLQALLEKITAKPLNYFELDSVMEEFLQKL